MIAVPTEEQVRRHVQHLRTVKGMSYSSICKRAGVPKTVLSRFITGRDKTIHPHAAIALMGVQGPRLTPTAPDDETFVPACGTRRRIQALLYLGWTHQEMRRRSGVRTAVTLAGKGEWVTVQTHVRIARLYDELWDVQGPSPITRRWARKRGYLPPMAWDDDTIDDPSAWGDLGPLQEEA